MKETIGRIGLLGLSFYKGVETGVTAVFTYKSLYSAEDNSPEDLSFFQFTINSVFQR